jgi:AcrR family transcriptional regulator
MNVEEAAARRSDATPPAKRRPRPTGSRRPDRPEQAQASDASSDSSAPRSRRGNATRQEILAAAPIVFARMGYGGTRLEDIAKEAGTSRTSVYHYFPSRREIFIEIGRIATLEFHRVVEVARAIPTAWARDDVATLIDAYLAYLDRHGPLMSTWTQATWDDTELRNTGLAAQLKHFTAFGEQLARLRGSTDLEPAYEGMVFLGMMERLWYFARNGVSISDHDLRHTLLIEVETILARGARSRP